MTLIARLSRLAVAPMLLLSLLAGGVQAQVTSIQAGREYMRLSAPQPVNSGARIEILEVFYYGCPICYEFQPHFSRWLFKAPNDVALRRVPALSSENWEPFARLFYTLDTLGELHRLHWPIYDNFHFDGLKLNDEKVMLQWVTRNGLDPQKFEAVYRSEDVAQKLAQSRAMMKSYDIRGVPSIIVDGKFVTSARMAGGTRQLAQVIDALVILARKERAN